MAKYFARINRETQGPFTLSQLIDAGVRPSTYVWTKEMDDWQRASDVADVCRAMRLRLAGLPVPGEETVSSGVANGTPGINSRTSEIDRLSLRNFYGIPEPDAKIDYNIKPQGVSMFMAVMVAFLCFPFTGILAIWFAFKFNNLWHKSERDNISSDEQRRLRVSAYEQARMYRMMIGISFSLGCIMYGVMLTARL